MRLNRLYNQERIYSFGRHYILQTSVEDPPLMATHRPRLA